MHDLQFYTFNLIINYMYTKKSKLHSNTHVSLHTLCGLLSKRYVLSLRQTNSLNLNLSKKQVFQSMQQQLR